MSTNADLRKFKFTDHKLATLAPPASGQVTYYDSDTPGLAVRVSVGGAKTWIVQRRVKSDVSGKTEPYRHTLGRYPTMPIDKARAEARATLTKIEQGINPRQEAEEARALERQRKEEENDKELLRELQQFDAEVKAKKTTFGAVRDQFLTEYCDRKTGDGKFEMSAAGRKLYRYHLRTLFASLESEQVAAITRRDIRARLDTIKAQHGGYTANRAFSSLRRMLNWAVEHDYLTTTPTDKVKRPTREVARKRVLSACELYYLWQALPAAPAFEAPLKLLLLTAQRREEVGGLRWSELRNLDGDSPLWRIPGHRAKNGNEHLVPISPAALSIIDSRARDSDFLFTKTGTTPVSGYSNGKEAIEKELGRRLAGTTDQRERAALESLLGDWRFHDFRRTAATVMADIGASRDVVEKILNHTSGTRGGVAGIYNRSELLDERRIALEMWAKYLSKVTAQCLDDRALEVLTKELRSEHRRRLLGEPAQPRLQLVPQAVAA